MIILGVLFLLGTAITSIWTSPSFENAFYTHSSDLQATTELMSEDQLPEDVLPTRYLLELIPNFENETISGNVKINLSFKKDSDRISLHAHSELMIEESTMKLWQNQKLIGKGGKKAELKRVAVQRVQYVPEKSVIVIYLKQLIKQGEKGELEINFSGSISNSNQGIFKGNYKENGEEQFYWATNLRPNNTRRLFPCFDEPSIKTPFTVSIHRPKELRVLFNTHCKYTERINDVTDVDYFETTKPMSTFAFGFVISQLQLAPNQPISETDKRRISLRLWGRSEINKNLQVMYEKLTTAYDHLAQYFGVDIPLGKIDIIAIPELPTKMPINNWGLIVFNESELLDDGYYRLIQELIYQWLGSFITPHWWNDDRMNYALNHFLTTHTVLEINDGLEFYGIYPRKFLYSFYYSVGRANPIHRTYAPWKIATNAEQVEYLLRMFNFTLGAETFKKAIQNLILGRQYITYTAEDLWDALTNQAHKDNTLSKDYTVNEIAESWFTNDRIPALSVERNYQLNTAKITQRMYLREDSSDVPERDNLLWWIPLVIHTQEQIDFTNSKPHSWMNGIRQLTIRDLPDENKFIIINPQEIGPFLVNYDEHNWYLLANYLQTEEGRNKIPSLTRAKLLHDAWNLALAGNVSYATAFNMTLFVKLERNADVLKAFISVQSHIGSKIKTSELCRKFSKYIITQLLPTFEELGSPRKDEENWKRNLRGDINHSLCMANYRPCIEEALSRFKNWMQSKNPDAENSSNYFMYPVIKWGSLKEWEFLLNRVINFPSTGDQDIRNHMIDLLTGLSSPEGMEKLYSIALLETNGNFSDSDICRILHKEDKVLLYILSNNWDLLKNRFVKNRLLWNKLIYSVIRACKTKEEYEMLVQFYEQRKGEFGSAEEIIRYSLKEFKEKDITCDDNLPDLEKWLDDFLNIVDTKKLDNVMMKPTSDCSND